MRTWVHIDCYGALYIVRWRPWRTAWMFEVLDFG